MKRVLTACIQQTLHFQLKEGVPHAEAAEAVKKEYAQYRQQLDRKRTKYKIVSEENRPDGSIVVKLKKQYNDHDCGDYLD